MEKNQLNFVDFPVFNIADVIIDLGVFMLFIDIFFLSEDDNEDEVLAEASIG